MLQGALPLLTRSLRDNARLRRAHAFRILSVLLIFGMLVVSHILSFAFGAPGLRFFTSLSLLNFGLITLAGFSFFSSVITEDKEEGTLGLLKLADVSRVSIVLGKSTSRLIAALVVFVGQFPFALLAMVLGGVTVPQIWSAYVALAAYMVLVANAALLCSVICRRSGTASVIMLLLLCLLLGGPAALLTAHSRLLAGGTTATAESPFWSAVVFLDETSILTRLETILSTGFKEPAFGPQVWLSLGVAFVCLVISCAIFDWFTEYMEPAGPRRGRVKVLASRRRSLTCWRWPLVWKDFHFVAGGTPLVLAKLLGYPAAIGLLFWQRGPLKVVTGCTLEEAAWMFAGTVLGIELLLTATRMFQRERKFGTLPCLALLPKSTATIVFAKGAGCLLGLTPSLLLIAGLWIFWPMDLPAPDRGFELGVAALVAFALVLQLTLLYSLIVRWGALPLAIATLLISGTCLVPIASVAVAAVAFSRDEYGGVGPIVYLGGVLSAVLQLLIGMRFRSAAAE